MATAAPQQTFTDREQMNLVVVGHVDHGKSTVIGRLMADTGSLPEGKLDFVKAMCEKNARPFEYAFLLDALKDEQAQGITIDTARVFFKTAKRNYIINDAPGHIEFLKNMITGAARAECALLVIDAAEGIQENSKRHGYMISMLGLKQIAVLVNKMDLVDYSQEVFEQIKRDYTAFLGQLKVFPSAFIPVAAREGDNIANHSENMAWFDGPNVLEQVDAFERLSTAEAQDFRMPVQDIYKFTQNNDDRRIVSGTIESGTISVGDNVMFYPSGKKSTVKSIEGFNAAKRESIGAPWATGVTLTTQIYIKPGELMCKASESKPEIGRRFRANMFWMGRQPMVHGKNYKMKIGSLAVTARLADVVSVLDASELSSVVGKQEIERHDVAECIIETTHPVAYDKHLAIEQTGRFVIVDDFEIAGAGVVLEPLADSDSSLDRQHVKMREQNWERGMVSAEERWRRNGHKGQFIVFVGRYRSGKRKLAKEVERQLFERKASAYYFGLTNLIELESLDRTQHIRRQEQDAAIERLGEMGRVMTDVGLLMLTCITDIDDFDMERLKELNHPNDIVVVSLGENQLDQYPVDLKLDANPDYEVAAANVIQMLRDRNAFHAEFEI